jgi:hypothetical protein
MDIAPIDEQAADAALVAQIASIRAAGEGGTTAALQSVTPFTVPEMTAAKPSTTKA